MAFDLRKIDKTEAGEPFEITCDGENFTLPPPRRAGWTFLDHVANRRIVEAMRELLPPDDLERFMALRLDFEDINAMLDAYMDHAATTVGESPASAPSSKSTQRQSKPTSDPDTTPA